MHREPQERLEASPLVQLMDNSRHGFSPEANFLFSSVFRLTLPSFLQHWLANPFPLALFSHLFGFEHCSIDRTDSCPGGLVTPSLRSG